MPLPIIGAAGVVGKLFGAGIKALKGVRLKRVAKKKQEKAEKLAAQATAQFQNLSGKLFTINQPDYTEAQKAVFPEKETNPMVNYASAPVSGSGLKKIPIWAYIAGGVVLLFIIFKLK